MPSIFGPMTVGEILDRLKDIARTPADPCVGADRERCVIIDWNNLSPGGFSSYRGYYDHLAICFDGKSPPNLSAFTRDLEAQIGAVHTGWKGGEYTMFASTPVWVANPGCCAGWGVASVRDDDGYSVTLVTQMFD